RAVSSRRLHAFPTRRSSDLFSARTVGADTGFVLTYERAARRHDQTQMTAEVDLAATDGDTAELRISASYLDAIDLRGVVPEPEGDRKSTRLNSSHVKISYAV